LKRSLRGIIARLLLVCLVFLLAACGTIVPTEKPSVTPSPSQTATTTPTPTLTPTSTPQPSFAVLLAPPGADQATVDTLQSALNDIIIQSGLQWQVRQQLTIDDLVPALQLVVAVPPDTGLTELIAAAPDTQFLALGIPGLPAAPNLTTIASEGGRPDQEGFIAGVIAAMLSDDWRVGVISISDTAEGRSARTGLLNGTIYFCGLCRPAHPPFYEYPMYFELPSTATSVEWQEAANYMVDHDVRTVYVYPGAGDEAMLSILADAKINIFSSGEPAPSASSAWVVSLDTDPIPLIQSQVAGLLDGSIQGGQSLVVPIQFSQVNPIVFTPGKQNSAQKVLSDLEDGFIDTGVDLTTGENTP
jgi:hypothetical protein